MTVAATAKRRRRQARLSKRYKARAAGKPLKEAAAKAKAK